MSEGAMAVVGGGTMGTGIAYVFALAGWKVTVVEPNESRVDAMFAEIASAAEGAIARGKLRKSEASALQQKIGRVSTVGELDEELDLVVESVPELLGLKRSVLVELEGLKPKLLASNTSSISIDRLAEVLKRPGLFIGMHFFNPVWSLPLVEIVRGTQSTPETVAAAVTCVEAIGKQSIVVADVPGFATSRLDLIASLEAMRMLEDGVASAEDIDRAAELAYRHPVGPLRLSDIVGLDVRLDIARSLEQTYGERYRPPQLLIDMVAAGRLGRKSGRGFYHWPSL